MKAHLTHDAWKRMRAFVDLCPNEISGLAKVRIEGGVFIVTDVEIFEQVVSPTHSDIPGAALAKFQVELIRRGENPKDWFCWWHSHAKMKTFFSGTDTSTIDSSTDFKMMLSIVTNHAHEFSARFDLYEPVRMTQVVAVEVLEDEDDTTMAECRAEIAKKVSTRPVVSASYGIGFDYTRTQYKHPHTGVKSQIEIPKKLDNRNHTAAVTDDERAEYGAEVQELQDAINTARIELDFELVQELADDLYEKRIDGYYAGLETLYPVKRLQ